MEFYRDVAGPNRAIRIVNKFELLKVELTSFHYNLSLGTLENSGSKFTLLDVASQISRHELCN